MVIIMKPKKYKHRNIVLNEFEKKLNNTTIKSYQIQKLYKNDKDEWTSTTNNFNLSDLKKIKELLEKFDFHNEPLMIKESEE